MTGNIHRLVRNIRKIEKVGLKSPAALADEIVRLRKSLAGMVESYDILTKESPLAWNTIALGVIRGAFIQAVDEARKLAQK